ncbi:MAG: hypothetical protein AB1Z98_15140 [Nannocystaceae bacterium]
MQRFQGFALGVVVGLGVLGVACGDDGGTAEGTTGPEQGSSSSSGEPIVAPSIFAEVDVAVSCSVAGATRVELQATRVGCVDPPPAPCTLPEVPRPVIGEAASCPPEGSPQNLRVELDNAGRYQVEVVTFEGELEQSRVCYGFAGESELVVTEAEIAGNSVFVVAPLDGSPCS